MHKLLLIGFLVFAALGRAWAEAPLVERVLGLWQSDGTYLELNADGTFFSAGQTSQDDIFGTYALLGNAVYFSYGRGARAFTAQKTLHFDAHNRMWLVDSEQQSIIYERVRHY